jgi:predicted ribosomally synthesized peptide with SipW-like signal peptide
MSKKKLLSLSLVVIMIAILSFSSLAWFTDNDSAENDFNIGGAGTGDSTDIFDIEVKENIDGEDQPVDNAEFDDILPGDNYTKEAFITNNGAYEQYVRVTMTITDWTLINGGITGSNGVVTIKMDKDFKQNWQIVGQVGVKEDGTLTVNSDGAYDPETDSLTVVMYLKHKLQADETVYIMDSVSVSTKATQEDFKAEGFADGFQIKIHAEAAQTENILDEYDSDPENEWRNAMNTFKALDAE